MADVERKPKEVVVSDLAQISAPKELSVRGSDKIFTLKQAKEEYLRNPTPESATQFNDFFWAEACRAEGKGREIVIPNLPKTVELKKGEIQFFDPLEVSLVDLGNMFPKIKKSWVIKEGAKIVDNNDNSGYFSTEMVFDAPYRNTKKGQLVETLKQEGLQQMSLKHYIIFGQMMYVLEGKYPDQRTWSRLGSDYGCYGYAAIRARFNPGGSLDAVPRLIAGHNFKTLGGRGEREIKVA